MRRLTSLPKIEDLRGKIAVCSRGRLGLITGVKLLDWGLSYVGIGLDTSEGILWSSRTPTVLTYEDLNDFLEDFRE